MKKIFNSNFQGETDREDTTFCAYAYEWSNNVTKISCHFGFDQTGIFGPFNGTIENVYKRLKERHS